MAFSSISISFRLSSNRFPFRLSKLGAYF